MHQLQRNLVLASAALLTGTSASAAILIDGDFTGLAGQAGIAFQQSLFGGGTNAQTDLGFFARPTGDGGTSTSLTFAGGQATVGGLIAGSNGGSTFPAGAFGQVNQDNQATTGIISFTFDVASVTNTQGEQDSFNFFVEVFDVSNATGGNLDRIRLQAGSNAGLISGEVTPIGSPVSTGVIAGPGTFTTGTIDLGSGFDRVAIRITPVNDGSNIFDDQIVLNSITVNGAGNPIPEPATAGLAAAGLALLVGRRRR